MVLFLFLDLPRGSHTLVTLISRQFPSRDVKPWRQQTWRQRTVLALEPSDGSDSSSSGSALSLSGSAGSGNFEPTLYNQRWVQLGILSMLALLSDLVCFSMAAAPSTWSNVYSGHNPTDLVDVFLCANVLACLTVTDLARVFGLRRVVLSAATIMSAGCLLRSGIPLTGGGFGGVMPSYAQEIVGTVLVGIAQPFFQCTPPLLSATWFGTEERALATAVAINFNQVGIGSAFLLGGSIAGAEAGMSGLSLYFSLITLASIVVTGATAWGFQVSRLEIKYFDLPPFFFLH